MSTPDLISTLAGIPPGSALDAALARRDVARTQSQATHDLLFHPAVPGPVTVAERRATALFVALLHGEGPVAAHLAALLGQADPALVPLIRSAAGAAAGSGPQGRFPAGPLSAEDRPVIPWVPDTGLAGAIGPRLTAALTHARLLTLHPRDATPAALQRLLDAGWTTPGIVTLSQIAAFLSYQIRVVAGLSQLAARRAAVPAPA